jgi:carbon monoxide dehydrogenase subunit G
MQFEESFTVAAPADQVWERLVDVPTVVPCIPGAELTETIDDENWKGKVRVKVGPVSLSFTGKVNLAERDDTARRLVLGASATEQRGKGGLTATVTARVDDERPGVSRVHVEQDLRVSGQAAQLSRGMLHDVSARLMRQFGECLSRTLAGEPEPAAAAPGGRDGSPPAPEVGAAGESLSALSLARTVGAGMAKRTAARVRSAPKGALAAGAAAVLVVGGLVARALRRS